MKQIEKQGKTKTVNTGLKLSKFLRKVGLDMRRKIFGEIIDKRRKFETDNKRRSFLDPAVSEGLNNFGISTIQGYGLTETSPVLTAERPWAVSPGSVGTPMNSVKIRIEEKKTKNGIGEIVAQGPNVMQGYYNQPEETAKAIVDGWFYTEIWERLTAKGNLIITGRKKNVIVLKNGKNVFPEEIEEMIMKLPYVSECMMFTREKHNELVLWCEIVYEPALLEEESITREQLAARFAKDLADINDILPKYKHIKSFHNERRAYDKDNYPKGEEKGRSR